MDAAMIERVAIAAAAGLLGMGLTATIVFPPRPILVWNASASAPIGLYRISPVHRARAGDMVIARPPGRYRSFAARRHYLPANVPLVKRIAAASGDIVCASGHEIIVNERRVAERRPRDGKGRLMPWWSGCVTLRPGSLFLLMDDPASFDGRYFGPTEPRDVLGQARPIWTR